MSASTFSHGWAQMNGMPRMLKRHCCRQFNSSQPSSRLQSLSVPSISSVCHPCSQQHSLSPISHGWAQMNGMPRMLKRHFCRQPKSSQPSSRFQSLSVPSFSSVCHPCSQQHSIGHERIYLFSRMGTDERDATDAEAALLSPIQLLTAVIQIAKPICAIHFIRVSSVLPATFPFSHFSRMGTDERDATDAEASLLSPIQLLADGYRSRYPRRNPTV